MWGLLLSFLPLTGLATLWAALHYRGKSIDLQERLDSERKHNSELRAVLGEQGKEIQSWKAQVAAAQWRASLANQDAGRWRRRLGELENKLKANPAPADAPGAIEWLEKAAEDLKDEQ